MVSKIEDEFDLDEILAEENQKKNNRHNYKINQSIMLDKSKDLDESNNRSQNGDNINNDNNFIDESVIEEKENFNVDINYDDENILIDEALLNDEDIPDIENGNIIKNLFKNDKLKSIKDNDIQNGYIAKEEFEEEQESLDQNQILEILKNNKKFLIKRLILILISLILSFGTIITSSIYNIVYDKFNILAVVNLIALLIAIFSSSDEIIDGFKSLAKKKSNFNGFISLVSIVSVIQATLMIFNIQTDSLNKIFTPSVILILLFNILSKYQLNKIMKLKSRYISICKDVESISYAGYNNILDPEIDKIKCFAKESDKKHIFNLCFSNFNSLQNFKLAYLYLIIALCFIGCLTSYFINHNVFLAINTLVCLLVICYPLSKDFCYKYIVSRISKKLYKKQILLYKYSAIDKIKNCNRLIINNNYFFAPECFKLVKIKIFNNDKINDSIINIASLLKQSQSLLSKVFLDIINNKLSLIKDVKNLTKNDNLGLSGVINNQKIIFGTGDYMLDNNIVIHSKYVNFANSIAHDKSLKVLYVAIDNLLTALFLIKVTPLKEVFDYLNKLNKNDLKITLALKDPFISAQDVSYIYGINNDEIDEMIFDDKESIWSRDLGIVHNGGLEGFISSIVESLKISQLFKIISILEFVSLILTGFLIIMFVLLDAMDYINFSNLIMLQLFWFLLIFLLSNIKR